LIIAIVGSDIPIAFALEVYQHDSSAKKLARADYAPDSTQVSEPELSGPVGSMVSPPANLSLVDKAGAVRPIMVFTPFEHDSNAISQEGKKYLADVVCPALRQKNLRGNYYEISGHTDGIGSADANMKLSRNRAIAIKNYLVHHCQFDPRRISVKFHGGNIPMVPNTTERNRNLNNRVELRVLP